MTYENLLEEVSNMPEPAAVLKSEQLCPVHGGQLISMPRDVGGISPFKYKCVWKECPEGF